MDTSLTVRPSRARLDTRMRGVGEADAALQPDSIAKTLKVLAYAYEQKKNLRAASECTTKELGILRETLKNNLKDPAITDCLQRMMGLRKQLKAMGQ